MYIKREFHFSCRLCYTVDTVLSFRIHVFDIITYAGPYVLGFGGLTYLLSKEIIVVEHTFLELISLGMAIWLINYKWGAKMAAYLDRQTDVS